jgi:hypothetical protein
VTVTAVQLAAPGRRAATAENTPVQAELCLACRIRLTEFRKQA